MCANTVSFPPFLQNTGHALISWHGMRASVTGAAANADVTNPAHYFLLLLDAHNLGCERGVSEDVFRSIFHACDQCGRYVTQRMAYHHQDGDVGEDIYSDSESLDWPRECVFLRMGSDAGGRLSAHEYRRTHCLGPCKS